MLSKRFNKLKKKLKLSNKSKKSKEFDPVTNIDKSLELFLRTEITKKFSKDGIIGEEFKAKKTKSIAPTFTAILIPSLVPTEIEDKKLSPILWLEISISETTFSVWGYIILEITIAPGAAITEAANKLLANSNFRTGSSPPKNPI